VTEFNRAELLKTLDQCRPAIAAVGLIPALSHLWFDGKFVYAYGGGLGIRRKLECDFQCGLPGKILLDLLKTSALEKVWINQTEQGVVLQMGKAKINLAQMPIDEQIWPFPKALPKEAGLPLSEKIFDVFKQLPFVKSSKETKAVHYGIVVMVSNTEVGLYATDSICIAKRAIEVQSTSMPTFIAPWPFVAAVVDLLSGKKAPHLWQLTKYPITNLDFDPNREESDENPKKLLINALIAGVPGTMIASNLLELDADPSKIMTKRFTGKLRALPKGLEPLLQRATILAGTEEPTLAVSIAKGVMRLKAKFKTGMIDERIELDGGAPSVNVKISANLVSAAIKWADKFAISENELLLSGADGFQYMLGTKE